MSTQRNYYNPTAARAAAAKARACAAPQNTTPMPTPAAAGIHPSIAQYSPITTLPAPVPSSCNASEDTVCYTVKHGATGPMGPQGYQGQAGQPGQRGATGPMGPQGHQGQAGQPGQRGATGPQGLPGAMGAPGQRGPQGPAGCAGPAGPTEVYMVTSQVCQIPPHHVIEDVKAICPPGMFCISGGYESDNHNLTVTHNAAVDHHHAWEVSCYNNTNRPCSVQAYAICVPEHSIKPIKEPRMPGQACCNVRAVPCQPPAYPNML